MSPTKSVVWARKMFVRLVVQMKQRACLPQGLSFIEFRSQASQKFCCLRGGLHERKWFPSGSHWRRYMRYMQLQKYSGKFIKWPFLTVCILSAPEPCLEQTCIHGLPAPTGPHSKSTLSSQICKGRIQTYVARKCHQISWLPFANQSYFSIYLCIIYTGCTSENTSWGYLWINLLFVF